MRPALARCLAGAGSALEPAGDSDAGTDSGTDGGLGRSGAGVGSVGRGAAAAVDPDAGGAVGAVDSGAGFGTTRSGGCV